MDTAGGRPGKIDVEKLSSVARDELEQNIDAILERVKGRESPILIRDGKKADALLFGWGDYWRRFSTLHTSEEIAELLLSDRGQRSFNILVCSLLCARKASFE